MNIYLVKLQSLQHFLVSKKRTNGKHFTRMKAQFLSLCEFLN